jgi:hypothetical protein
VGDKYTLVINLGDPEPPKPKPPVVEDSNPEPTPSEAPSAPLSDPPLSQVVQNQPPKKSTSKSGEYSIVREDAARVTKEGPKKITPIAGQVWQTRDQRRSNSPPFTVVSVDAEFAYTNKGAKISLKRWRNYRLVEAYELVSRQSSG